MGSKNRKMFIPRSNGRRHSHVKITKHQRHKRAYSGVMAQVGFDLIEDTIRIMEDGNANNVVRDQYYHYDKPYIFLRDVDVEPIVLSIEDGFVIN